MADGLDDLRQKLQDWIDKRKTLRDEIEELRKAYNELVAIKKQAEKLNKRMTKTVTDDSSKWSGSHHNTFLQIGGEAVNNVSGIVQSLDTIVDEINWCIKDRNDELDICGYFVNSLTTQIQNWTN